MDADDQNPLGSASGMTDPDFAVVVVLAASAGGLDALNELAPLLPVNAGVVYVVVQHLSPDHTTRLPELLARRTGMPVRTLDDGALPRPDTVFVAPPKQHVAWSEGAFRLVEPESGRAAMLPIDAALNALANALGQRTVAVILSGAGNDGARGVREVRAAGGLAIAQSPDSAGYDGMPRSAIATGAVDAVADIQDIPARIEHFARSPHLDADVALEPDAGFRAVLDLVRSSTGHDFAGYKDGVLRRRVLRRMSLRRQASPVDYYGLLRRDAAEIETLFHDLLIGVTSFFRDREVWETLDREVLRPLVTSRRSGDAIRAWVPGCATGEEAYSLAMLLLEAASRQDKQIDLQIYASDIDERSIAVARQGRYPVAQGVDLSPERLRTHFRDEGDFIVTRKRLRDSVIFAPQNLVNDPPFSRLDIISCRNLLIYLDQKTQRRVFDLFHFALHPNAVLMLGTSESVSDDRALFEPIDRERRIFRRLESDASRGPLCLDAAARFTAPRPGAASSEIDPPTIADEARQALIDAFAPAAVILDDDFRIIYGHGRLGRYLDFPEGAPNSNIAELCPENMRRRIRWLLRRCRDNDEPATVTINHTTDDGAERIIDARAVGTRVGGERRILLSFNERKEPDESPRASATGAEDDEAVRRMEEELQSTRHELYGAIDALETSNEKLRASNEEVLSMNEELQNANEQLETSREELQSLNEELSTINAQLEEKVSELEDANNDLDNLLNSAEVATIFLDTEFRIRKATPAAADLLSIIDSDIGRPLADLAFGLEDPMLFDDASDVLARLATIERETVAHDGRWFIRRVLPYRTARNAIEGVVVTYTDVTRIKTAHGALEQRERQQAVIADLGCAALSTDGLSSLFEHAVRVVRETLDADMTKVLELTRDRRSLLLRAGVGWNAGLVGVTHVPAGVDSQAGFTLQSRDPVVVPDMARETRFFGPELLIKHGVVAGMSCVIGPRDAPWGVLGVHARRRIDFTQDDANFLASVANVLAGAIARCDSEERLRDNEERLRLALESGDMGVWEWNVRTDDVTWNDRMHTLLGLPPGGAVSGDLFFRHVHPDDIDMLRADLDRTLSDGSAFTSEFRIIRADGVTRILRGRGVVRRDEDGEPIVIVGVNYDVTEAREAERALESSRERLVAATEAARVGTWRIDVEARRVTRDESYNVIIGHMGGATELDLRESLLTVHPDDRDLVRTRFENAIASGASYECEHRITRMDGELRWMRDRGRITRMSDGRVSLIGAAIDITEIKEAEIRKRIEHGVARIVAESDSLTDSAPAILDAFISELGVDVAELWMPGAGGRLTLREIDCSHDFKRKRAWMEVAAGLNFGVGEGLVGHVWNKATPIWSHDYRGEWTLLREHEARQAGVQTTIAIPIVAPHRPPAGVIALFARRRIKGSAAAMETITTVGHAIGVLFEREESIRQRDALIGELNHRVKNTLAVVRSIASRTLERTNELEDFRVAFEGRLQAMAVSHRLLTDSEWEGGDLRRLIHDVMAPFCGGEPWRLALEGPTALLETKATQALAMVVHELASNAEKYGALGTAEGAVEVVWSFPLEDGRRRFHLAWIERDGPEIRAEPEEGFGSTLIRRLVEYELNGAVEHVFMPAGVQCRIDVPARDNVVRFVD